jgi:hypothetical protein
VEDRTLQLTPSTLTFMFYFAVENPVPEMAIVWPPFPPEFGVTL